MKIPKQLRTLFVPGQRLSQRVAFAGGWLLALRVARQGLAIIRLIILARLLSPEAFGLVSIALVAMMLLTTFTEFGFAEALVQRKGDIRDYLDTYWIMCVIRGMILGGILFGIAPLVASYFNAPAVKPIIQVLSLVPLLDGLTSSGIVYYFKEMEGQKQFVWNTSSTITDFVVSVSAAFILRNVWALVIGALASYIVSMVVSFAMHPYRPKLRFDTSKAKEMFFFGGWALLFSIGHYVFTNVDTIIIGRLLGVVPLGFYTMAHKIGDLIGREMAMAGGRVIFPTFSKLQDDFVQLRRAFMTCVEAIAFVTFPIAVGIYILAPDFTSVLLGEQWTQAVPAMQILGIAAAIYSLIITGGTLYYAVGKPRIRFFIITIAVVIMVGLLFPLSTRYGLIGAAIAVLAGNVAGLIVQIWTSTGILKSGIKEMLRPMAFPTIISIILGISLTLAKRIFSQVSLGEFVIMLCVAAVVYVACSFLLWKISKTGPIQIVNIFLNRN
jgi:lipopolysaccharide exporter